MKRFHIREMERRVVRISLVKDYRMEQVKPRVTAFCQEECVFQGLGSAIGKIRGKEDILYVEQIGLP
jgi:hypothetical protein